MLNFHLEFLRQMQESLFLFEHVNVHKTEWFSFNVQKGGKFPERT